MNQEGKMNKKFAQVKINLCTSTFSKNFFILILIKSSLDSWILILILGSLNLESWFLILGIKFPLEPWSVLDLILNSFFDSWYHHLCYHEVFLTFELFVIIFVIIKTLWINLDSSWSLLLQSPPFLWWQLLKSINTHTQIFPSRSLT